MIRYWWLGVIFLATLILPLVIGEFWIHIAVEIFDFSAVRGEL